MQIHVFYPYFIALIALTPLLLYWLRRTPRRLAPLRRRVLVGLRVIVLGLMVAGLVRLSLTQPYQQANVVFVLDLSHSIATAARQAALDFIQAVSQHKRPQDSVGLVVFGTDASLEQEVSPQFTLSEITSEVDGTSTNIARALQVGIASFPSAGARRLVLLSDGNENVASAAEAALIARALGVEIFPVPLGRPAHEPEVRVEQLSVPAHVQVGSPYYIEAVLFSTVATEASLELFRDGAFVGRQEVTLQPGKQRYRFLQQANTEGVQLYQLIVNSSQDTQLQNNRWQAFTEVVGRPKILLLYDPPGHFQALAEALRQQGLEVDTRPWQELPHTLSGYLEYAALIFDNVAGFGISVSQMEVLERYVQDMGGGVLMLGGEKSFGAGGYYRTPLEKILPVDMDIPTKMSIPSLAMVMVIDRSDSMGGSVSGATTPRFDDRTTKLEVAKIAAFSAIKLLNPFDQVGVLGFNADWEWTVPMSEAGKREQIASRLAALTHSGGTDLFKATQEGLRVLTGVQAVKKHLIALSDGLTPNMDFESLMRDAVGHNITVTTVAMGRDADQTLMDAIAHWGQGRSYHSDDALNIPRIFTSETILVSRGIIEETPFQPVLRTDHELLRGIDLAQMPNLYGYVITYGKPAAEILLVTPKDDPLLAVQRYGLGRTAAFTADLSMRWGKDWVRWPQFSQFVAQLLRWLQRVSTSERFDVQIDVQEGQAMVQANIYNLQEQFVNNLDLQGSRVLTPEKQTIPISLTQTAPGRYQGQFPVQGNGEYLLSLVGQHGETAIGPKTVGLTLPYSAEYLGLDINYSLLNRLAERTGSQVLRTDVPADMAELLFATPEQHLTALKDYWPWFVFLALCLFVVEIAVRQVLLPASWTARWQRRTAATPQEPAPTYTYDELEAIVHRRAEDLRRRSTTVRDARTVTTAREDARRSTPSRQ
jgi:uncharacterized membrane protein/Mg-chelatase subunit ChlD